MTYSRRAVVFVVWAPCLLLAAHPTVGAIELSLAKSLPAPGNNLVQLRRIDMNEGQAEPQADLGKYISSAEAKGYSVALKSIEHYGANQYFIYEFLAWRSGERRRPGDLLGGPAPDFVGHQQHLADPSEHGSQRLWRDLFDTFVDLRQRHRDRSPRIHIPGATRGPWAQSGPWSMPPRCGRRLYTILVTGNAAVKPGRGHWYRTEQATVRLHQVRCQANMPGEAQLPWGTCP